MGNTRTHSLILVIVVVSFMGFCVENVFIGLSHGFIDNRNMILPFLLGYGLSIFAFYHLFGTPGEPLYFKEKINFKTKWGSTLYCFLIAFLGVSIGEILVGYATEWLCGIIWWNYTAIPLHLTRYTSVPTSLGFALLITIFMKYCFTPLMNAFSKIHSKVLSSVAVALIIILSIDTLNSAIYMFRMNNTLHLWKIEVKEILQKIRFSL